MLARLVLNSRLSDPPALASQSAGITGVSHCVRPNFKSFKWIIFIGCVFHDYQTMFLSLVEVLCSPMLLSTFSHFSLFHMAANILCFVELRLQHSEHSGSRAVLLSAGVISNCVSYVLPQEDRDHHLVHLAPS